MILLIVFFKQSSFNIKQVREYDEKKNVLFLEGRKCSEGNVQVDVRSGKEKENVNANAANSDQSKYNFKPSGIEGNWLLGTNTSLENESNFANAFKNRIADCPYDLTIPSTLTDDNGQTKIVEIIGPYAFYACADKTYNGKTRKLTLTKQVKVTMNRGLGYMDDLEYFKIEEGSVLEIIEERGLFDIGYYIGRDEADKRVTLILPSTLSSVYEDGIMHCNFFHTIIYCGSHPLSNSSDLEYVNIGTITDTMVKVTSQYPEGKKIFGRIPLRNRDAVNDAERECMKMAGIPAVPGPKTRLQLSLVLITSFLLSSEDRKVGDYGECSVWERRGDKDGRINL